MRARVEAAYEDARADERRPQRRPIEAVLSSYFDLFATMYGIPRRFFPSFEDER